jgi:hypothetical protein
MKLDCAKSACSASGLPLLTTPFRRFTTFPPGGPCLLFYILFILELAL